MGVGGSLVFRSGREVQDKAHLHIREYCMLLVILASVSVAHASYGSHGGFRSSYRPAPYQSYGSPIGYSRSILSYHGIRSYQPALAHLSRGYQKHERIPFNVHHGRFNYYEPRSYQKHAHNPYGRFQTSHHRPQRY